MTSKLILNDDYEEYICALSNDQHIINDPLVLSCGHNICKECLEKIGLESILCKICCEQTKRNLISDEKTKFIKESIQLNIESFLKIINKKMIESVSLLSGMFKM
jgi:hypothetical protein